MFKYVVLFSALFLITAIPQQKPIKLNWDEHFKGEPNLNSKYTALTSLVFRYGYESAVSNNKVSLKFNFHADVNPQKSWYKSDRIKNKEERDYLLKHEQGHVNLNFLLKKEAERVLVKAKYSAKDYKTTIKKLGDSVIKKYDNLQKQYDEETEHSLNKKSQQNWDKYIDILLESYN